MAARDVRAGGAYVEFSLRRKGLEKALRQVGQRIRQFGSQIRQIGAGLSAIGGAITAPFIASIATFAKVGDGLEKMSRRTGIAVESLSELQFAAEQNGTSLDTLERGIKTSQRAIIDLSRGLTTQVFAFEQIGLTFADLEKLSPEQQFQLIADKVSQVEDPTKRAAVAMQIFGRAGQELLPLLNQGAQGIEAFRAEARSLGIVIDDDTAKAAAAFTDALNVLKLQLKAAAVAVGGALGPALTRVADSFKTIGRAILDFLKENRKLIITVAAVGAGILAFGTAIIALGTAIGIAGFALTSLVGLLAALTSPIGLVIGGVIALGAALVKFTDAGGKAIDFLRDKFSGLLEIARSTLAGVGKALEGGDLQLAAKLLWTSIQLIFIQGTQGVINQAIKLKADVLKAITEITIGVIAEASKLWAGLQTAWANIGAGAKKLWENVKGDALEAFNLLRLQASKAANAVKGALDDSFNAQEANAQAEALFVDRQKGAQADRNAALKKINEEQAARIKAIEDEAKARKDAIESALSDELAAIDAGKKEEAAKLRAKIEGLRKERAELLRQADAVGGDRPRPGEPGFDGDRNYVPGEGRIREIARVAGITSSFNIRSLDNTSQDEARRLRAVNEKQLDEQKKTNRILIGRANTPGLAIA